ncbi:MAG: MFS transporter [Solirubrobacterales bacterium]|nr:MFS transporter [Solirubrobacterales bacterium]MCB1008320.1 MFS transporter [Acidobacteriota bacterium]MCB8970572.1 MFS transporter [Thermoleophilales bacterium]MCO5325733.1 MFS transporter [Solirubrobacterales bacterium]
MSESVQTGTIETRIPGRLDRLSWSKFHWRVVFGLGAVWILDGLEVTIIGFLAPTLVDPNSGIALTESDISLAAAIYVAGACTGALFFGQLTDRFGRKRLFLVTLMLYLVATVATAFAFAPWFFLAARFFTGAGIGGEYAAINSAIDELIPARARGRVDLIINGSFWLGAAAGGLLSLLFLKQSIFAIDVGWRVSFAMGAMLGIGILFVRRHVPESPRWLFIHGREEEAERIVDEIESEVKGEAGDLPEPEADPITVRQRKVIPFREIARTAFKLHPKRSTLGLSLFVGQAFLYNAVTFSLGLTLSTYLGVGANKVGLFYAVFAAGNFLGPLLLGRLFDTVGRKPMIAGTYLLSAVLLLVVAFLFNNGGAADPAFSDWGFTLALAATFFFASAGASSAYLTVSEIFPMEVRALAIAFFYAIGTAIGGISGPLVFERLAQSADPGQVAIGYVIGAVVMAIGGIAELFLGVRAEGKNLEEIATPLTVQDAEDEERDEAEGASTAPALDEESRAAAAERWRRRQQRERAGMRRYRLGPGSASFSPFFSQPAEDRPEWIDTEVDRISEAVARHGDGISARELSEQVGGRRWGPGRFHAALREAIAEGTVRRLGRGRYAPARFPGS